MRAGQRMVADDGYEVMLFPLPYMYVSQGENGSYSHAGTLNIDFLGYNSQGQHISDAPYYAPCSCHCVSIVPGSANGRCYQSDNLVHTPAGLQYVSFMFFHDENPPSVVGTRFTQGDVIGHTGTAGNVTGDHVHFNTAFGTYAGRHTVPPENRLELVNSSHIYQTCYVNDTTIIRGYGYNWVEFQGGITPHPFPRTSKFKWVLYANKIRERNIV